MSFTVSFDPSALFRAIERNAEVTGRKVSTVIKRQATIAAKEFINVIPPLSGATVTGRETFNLQLKAGKAATTKDVKACYMTKGEAYKIVKDKAPELAKQFWKLIQHDVPAARRFILAKVPELKMIEVVGGFDEAIYRRNRNPKSGRVKVKFPRQIVTEKKALTSLIKKQVDKVGLLKSGAYKAAMQAGLKPSGIPAWVKRQNGSGRGINKLSDKKKPYIELRVTMPYIDAHNKGGRLEKIVIKNRIRALNAQVKAVLDEQWSGKIK